MNLAFLSGVFAVILGKTMLKTVEKRLLTAELPLLGKKKRKPQVFLH
jgi:hypothetical protein